MKRRIRAGIQTYGLDLTMYRWVKFPIGLGHESL
jgi:hypothetical protein